MSSKVKSLVIFIILVIAGCVIYSFEVLHCLTVMYMYACGWFVISIINRVENVTRTLIEDRILIITGIIAFFMTMPTIVLKVLGVWILLGIIMIALYNVYKKLHKDKSKNDLQ